MRVHFLYFCFVFYVCSKMGNVHGWLVDFRKTGLDIQDDEIAKQVYAALTNMRWTKCENGQTIESDVTGSFRHVAGVVAAERRKGETYLDFYCSSEEGVVSDLIAEKMGEFGWTFESH